VPEHLPNDVAELERRIAQLVRTELEPLEQELDPLVDSIPAALADDVRQRSQVHGLWGLSLPSALGGSDASRLARVVAREALAATNLRLARLVLAPEPGPLAAATDELRERYLLPVVRGEKRCAFAFTEPADGTKPTTARREGDAFVLDGEKAWVSGGDEADLFTVVARIEGTSGAALFVVDRTDAGVGVGEPFRSLDGSSHTTLRLTGVRLAPDRLLGAPGEGMPRALRSIDEARLELAAEAVGAALWAIEQLALRLCAPHRSGTPLAEREGVRLRYAELRILAYGARSTLYRTARLPEEGDGARYEIMSTKVLASEAAGRIVDEAVQLSGGRALVVGHPLERLYRRVRAMRLAEGANDLLRLHLARAHLERSSGRL
jgi:alkylation response protein AidB-like acyl-CoA dehydrogenase